MPSIEGGVLCSGALLVRGLRVLRRFAFLLLSSDGARLRFSRGGGAGDDMTTDGTRVCVHAHAKN